VQGFLSIFGNITSIISQLLIIVATALVTYFLTRRGERKKKVRESIEELYRFLSQVDIWMKVTLRYLYKELDKMDYYRPVIPGEYLEDFTKEPECPIDRLEMLIELDTPSLKKYLPEYKFIVSEMRSVRYYYDAHKSRSLLDYYFGGVTFDEYEKMSGKQVNSMEEFFQYIGSKFPQLHDDLRSALGKLARKN
jgi:hypothetical protein